jgi:hypothetical protein
MRAQFRVVEAHDLAEVSGWFDREMRWLLAKGRSGRRFGPVFNWKGSGRVYFQNGNDPVSAR